MTSSLSKDLPRLTIMIWHFNKPAITFSSYGMSPKAIGIVASHSDAAPIRSLIRCIGYQVKLENGPQVVHRVQPNRSTAFGHVLFSRKL